MKYVTRLSYVMTEQLFVDEISDTSYLSSVITEQLFADDICLPVLATRLHNSCFVDEICDTS